MFASSKSDNDSGSEFELIDGVLSRVASLRSFNEELNKEEVMMAEEQKMLVEPEKKEEKPKTIKKVEEVKRVEIVAKKETILEIVPQPGTSYQLQKPAPQKIVEKVVVQPPPQQPPQPRPVAPKKAVTHQPQPRPAEVKRVATPATIATPATSAPRRHVSSRTPMRRIDCAGCVILIPDSEQADKELFRTYVCFLMPLITLFFILYVYIPFFAFDKRG